ncbi:hypothetical protein EW146_g621 [Bondarzewia mesenterica]|uniref:Uncharacterized protein n=1 Tax=Bondarzewia mesenterica TaxID=1095465 RepID=A0A4S4M7Q9_9AGAM|nr:hypothetical protein EW146_g621 [Bondarzewia mesenterica]
MASKSKSNPLALEDTLRDLALLRASDLDLSSILASASASQSQHTEIDASVELSYEFAREARKAVKIQDKGAVEVQGSRVEDARTRLEDVMLGLEGSRDG